MDQMPETRKTGIGVRLDLMISALKGARLESITWDYERRGNVALPARLGPGSHNFGVVARTLDRIIGRDDNHLAWLLAWYRGQNSGGLGHCGREILSPVYFDAHVTCAMVNHVLSRRDGHRELLRETRIFLENELALDLAHWSHGVVVACGTRAFTVESGSRNEWLAFVLGEKRKNLKGRTARFASDFEISLAPDLGFLRRIRSASGEIAVVTGAHGHASYFPRGPRCYNNPQPGAVSINGIATYLNPGRALNRKNLKGYFPSTSLAEGMLVSRDEGKGWEGLADLSGLGEVTSEMVIPGV